jgi:CheY-like chemotaxis protein
MAGEQILVVDDNVANMKLVNFVLVAAGFQVRTAGSAEEALAAIAAELPDLVLMDIQLPGTDGLTLTRRLKADPKTAGLVIVALTAYAMRGDDQKALDAGCSGYLTKPIDTRTFADSVASYLQVRQ